MLQVAVWNFKGQLVTSFEDHILLDRECNTNNIYITSEQDVLISCCHCSQHRRRDIEDENDEGSDRGLPGDPDDVRSKLNSRPVSINVSNILTGTVSSLKSNSGEFSK